MTNEEMYRELLHASTIPEGLHDGLALYLAYGLHPGSFLHAVLENDLVRAVNRADEQSARALIAIVRWLYNAAPAVAWGSRANVDEWMTTMRREREQVTA